MFVLFGGIYLQIMVEFDGMNNMQLSKKMCVKSCLLRITFASIFSSNVILTFTDFANNYFATKIIPLQYRKLYMNQMIQVGRRRAFSLLQFKIIKLMSEQRDLEAVAFGQEGYSNHQNHQNSSPIDGLDDFLQKKPFSLQQPIEAALDADILEPNLFQEVSEDLARLNPNPNPNPHLSPNIQYHPPEQESEEINIEVLCKEKVRSKWHREEGEKKGRFSMEQQKILSKAVGEFLALHDITYDEFLVILNQKNVINKILKRLNFYNILSSLLPNRSAYSCYRFLKRTFNMNNRKGRWTVEEEGKLLRLVRQYGKQWAIIAKQMGRTSDNVYDKYRSIGAANAVIRKHGNWTLSQLVKLLSLVEQRCSMKLMSEGMQAELAEEVVHNIHDHIDHQKAAHNSHRFKFHNYTVILKHLTPAIKEVPLQNIQWSVIASLLKSRTLIDCKNKFLQIMEMVIKGEKRKQESIITFIEGLNLKEEREIDWLRWEGQDFTTQQAKNRFFFLKKLVQGKSFKTFPSMLAELKTKMKRVGLY